MKKKKTNHSLFNRIFVPIAILLVLESAVFYIATAYGGITASLNSNADDVLAERVESQTNQIETLFVSKWSNFSIPVSSINNTYDELMKDYDVKLYDDTDLQKQFLTQTQPALVNMIRNNEVTGAYLILNNSSEYQGLSNDGTNLYGICIRDYDPTSAYSDNNDLSVVRCPSSIVGEIGITLQSYWDALYHFDADVPGDYYYKPLQAAYENPDADPTDITYFDTNHNFGGSDREVISYSIPLIDDTGYPYGVLGVEITTDYLKTLLDSSTLYNSNASSYVFVDYQEGSNEYHMITYDGTLYQQNFGSQSNFSGNINADGILECEDTKTGDSLSGYIHDISIYNHNTPYESHRLAVVGLVKTSVLYSLADTISSRLLLVSVMILILGAVIVFLVSRHIVRPVTRLSAKVRSLSGSQTYELERLNIDEIDDLVDSIEELSDKVNKNVVRTEFFSRMSHDMRTPMNAIIGFSSPELFEEADNQTMREYMDKIHVSGEYLLSLINEVLDMTKIESQRMELREEEISKENIADSVVPIIQEVADEKQIHFKTIIDEKNVYFYGDRQRLSQVFMNLLSNAVKFTPEGGEVTFEAYTIEEDNKEVITKFIVSDNGMGMSEAFQSKMYEPFAQEGKIDGGTGLGLAISKHIIELMGGTISCKSKEGVGTTFTINMVCKKAEGLADAIAMTSREEKQALDAKNAAQDVLIGKRILLCEDHPMNAMIAQKLLERKGMIVELAKNGRVGYEQFRDSTQGYYQLILMDIRMPEMTGLEATEAIRNLRRPDAATIPIIAMTANAFVEDVSASQKVGMNEHLSKPIDPEILYLTLEKYL